MVSINEAISSTSNFRVLASEQSRARAVENDLFAKGLPSAMPQASADPVSSFQASAATSPSDGQTRGSVPETQTRVRPTVQGIIEPALDSEAIVAPSSHAVTPADGVTSSPLDTCLQEATRSYTAASPFSAPFSTTSSTPCATAENNAFEVSGTDKSKAMEQVNSNPSRGPHLSMRAVSYLEKSNFGKVLSRHLKDLGETGRHMTGSYNGMFALYVEAFLTGKRANSERYKILLEELLQTIFDNVTNGAEGVRGSGQHAGLLSKVMLRIQQEFLDGIAALQCRVHALVTKAYEAFCLPNARLFIVLPVGSGYLDRTNLAKNKFRVYFLCECNELPRSSPATIPSRSATSAPSTSTPRGAMHHVHLAKHEGYDLQRPNSFFVKYGFHVLTIVEMLRYGITTPSFAVPELENLEVLGRIEGIMSHGITRELLKSKLDDTIGYIKERISRSCAKGGHRSSSLPEQGQRAELLAQLEPFLCSQNSKDTLGNLYKTVSTMGHVKWVCLDHYRINHDASSAQQLDVVISRNNMDDTKREFGVWKETAGVALFFCQSRESAALFYPRLQSARGVLKLQFHFLWDATKADIQSLCDAVSRSNVSILYIDGKTFENRPPNRASQTSNRLSSILQLLESGKLNTISLEVEFLDCALGLGGVPIPNLRVALLELGAFTGSHQQPRSRQETQSIQETESVQVKFFRFLSRLQNLARLILYCDDMDQVYSAIRSRISAISTLESLTLVSNKKHVELEPKAGVLTLSEICQGAKDIIEDNKSLIAIRTPFSKDSLASNIAWFDKIFAGRTLPLTVSFLGDRNETILEAELRNPGDDCALDPFGQRFRGHHSTAFIRWVDDDILESEEILERDAARDYLSEWSDATLDFPTLIKGELKEMLGSLAMKRLDSLHIICCPLYDDVRRFVVSGINPNSLSRLELSGENLDGWINDFSRVFTRVSIPLLRDLAIVGTKKRLLPGTARWIESMLSSDLSAEALCTLRFEDVHLSTSDWKSIISAMTLSGLKSLDFTGSTLQQDHLEHLIESLPPDASIEMLVLHNVSWVNSLTATGRNRLSMQLKTKARWATIQYQAHPHPGRR
ncbi:hypothetical protein BGZ58_008615 [Dissophora ornata]|nr:hypothetical protein BGZ58_008615 [Dissophora ornata]